LREIDTSYKINIADIHTAEKLLKNI